MSTPSDDPTTPSNPSAPSSSGTPSPATSSPPDGANAAPLPTSKKKVTLYFNASMLSETQHEAIRQDRSISWIIQAAWRRARDEIRRLPSVSGPTDDD